MGCDLRRSYWRRCLPISIHAPAWGATQSGDHRGQRRTISIHAPAWGATGGRAILRFNGEHFNPRTRMGCDRQSREHRAQPIYFNPRTRMGCDSIGKGVGSLTAAISIHAPGWGATIGTSPSSGRSSIFQSTHPGGVRHHRIGGERRDTCISIHAPGWGAT